MTHSRNERTVLCVNSIFFFSIFRIFCGTYFNNYLKQKTRRITHKFWHFHRAVIIMRYDLLAIITSLAFLSSCPKNVARAKVINGKPFPRIGFSHVKRSFPFPLLKQIKHFQRVTIVDTNGTSCAAPVLWSRKHHTHTHARHMPCVGNVCLVRVRKQPKK